MQYLLQYSFDHDSFHREALPLVALADAGDHEPVYHRARAIASGIRKGRWILEGNGTSLTEIDTTPPGPELTGFCFLLILSHYLHKVKVPAVIQYVWSGLESVGWSQDQLMSILHGMYPVTVLKPDWLPNPYKITDNAKPDNWKALSTYPWYVTPAHAFYANWITWQQVEQGRRWLEAARREFIQLDFTKFKVSYPVESPNESVPRGYDQLIRVYSKAARDRLGFFILRGA